MAALLTFGHELHASELDSLKLFYAPKIQEAPASVSSAKKDKNRQSPVKELVTVQRKLDLANKNHYQYNGFVSSGDSRIYIVNGKNIENIPEIKLLAATQSGRRIRLRLPDNKVIELSIGRTSRL